MLSPAERAEIELSIGELTQFCDRTPERDAQFEAATLVLVTKLMLALPAQKQNELGAEATGEAFQVLLDDLPTSCVAEAIRKWYRGECGMNERGEPYDQTWRPSPADLRRLALTELCAVRYKITVLKRLLKAEPLREFSEEHAVRMRQRIVGLGLLGASNKPEP
jgi:hypothetical protein